MPVAAAAAMGHMAMNRKDEIGDAVALGPTLTQFTTGPGGLVTLAPADADEAGSGGWDVIDDTNHLDGGFLRGEDWLNPDNMWMNLPEVSSRSSVPPGIRTAGSRNPRRDQQLDMAEPQNVP